MTLLEAEARYRNSQIERHNACVYLQKATMELGANSVKAANDAQLQASLISYLPLLGTLVGISFCFIPYGYYLGGLLIIGGIAGCVVWTIFEWQKVNRKRLVVEKAKKQLDNRVTKLSPDTMLED